MGYEEYVYVVVCFHAYSLLVNLINIFCFLIWNYFHIFAKRFKETGMDSQIFQLVLLEDARNFIRLLPQAAKEKVYYNIRKVQSGFKDKDLFKKLGLPDSVSAIGILTITPSEASIIACDIATKSGAVEIGFLDRFTGAVVLTGDVSAVEYALKQVTRTLGEMMRFTACPITRT